MTSKFDIPSVLLENFELVFDRKPIESRLAGLVEEFGARKIESALNCLLHRPESSTKKVLNPYGYLFTIIKGGLHYD